MCHVHVPSSNSCVYVTHDTRILVTPSGVRGEGGGAECMPPMIPWGEGLYILHEIAFTDRQGVGII